MKILIIGEYSGFSKNLKVGFEKLGHEVIIFHEGDSFKDIQIQNSHKFTIAKNFTILGVEIRRSWILNGIYQTIRFHRVRKKYNNYFDVVLIVNYEFMKLAYQFWIPRFTFKTLKKTLKNDVKIFLSSCGDDIVTFSQENSLRYFMPNPQGKVLYESNMRKKIFDEVKINIAGVIPTAFVYANSYRRSPLSEKIHIFETIQFPFDASKIKSNNVLKEKIIVFHGLNREISKGTFFILNAFKMLEEKYPDKVICIVKGKMSLNEYSNLLSETNIVVDQCNSYDYGYNALLAMAQGKVVLSGNELETQMELKRDDIPVVNILPVENDIFSKLEYFVLNPTKIIEQGHKSRLFVEDFHDPVKVALKYIDVIQ